MASSRKTGTNEQITTYDSAGGKDYSALATWESATDTNHVSDTESDVLECYKGNHDDYVYINGATNDSSYFRIIRPASGEGHSGIPLTDGTVVSFAYSAHVWGMLRTMDPFDQVQDVIIDFNISTTSKTYGIRLNENDSVAVGVLIKRCANASGQAWGIRCNGTADTFVINCLSHDCDDSGIIVDTGTGYIYNYTENSCGGSIEILSTITANTKNCVLDDTIYNSGTHNQTTNTTGTPTYVDSANDDFHLASGDTVAKDNGTDLSADANYAFDDDIDSDTRSGSWDIGFDEFVSAGPSTLTISVSDCLQNDAILV